MVKKSIVLGKSLINFHLLRLGVICLLAIGYTYSLNVAAVQAYGQGAYYSQAYYQAAYYTQSYYQSTYGVTFSTDVTMNQSLFVVGGISKGSGSFVIDHPLDPVNKLLYHSFVESPEAKNIYDGVATLNTKGEAVVVLPDYFETLNKDYRYQVKGLDTPAPNLYIKNEVTDNKFIISGGPPRATVSWQVTGIRQDPYILANPIINEVEKGPDQLVDKGEFLFAGYEQEGPLTLWSRFQNLLFDIWQWFMSLRD